jgi:hypothetical protein
VYIAGVGFHLFELAEQAMGYPPGKLKETALAQKS